MLFPSLWASHLTSQISTKLAKFMRLWSLAKVSYPARLLFWTNTPATVWNGAVSTKQTKPFRQNYQFVLLTQISNQREAKSKNWWKDQSSTSIVTNLILKIWVFFPLKIRFFSIFSTLSKILFSWWTRSRPRWTDRTQDSAAAENLQQLVRLYPRKWLSENQR